MSATGDRMNSRWASQTGNCQTFSSAPEAAHSIAPRKIVVLAEEAGGEVPEGHDHAAGERREVDDRGRLELVARVGDGVGEHQSSLGVGVGDLDRGAVVHRDDVVGAVALVGDHVLRGRGRSPVTFIGSLASAIAFMPPRTAAPPHMSCFMPRMPPEILSEYPPVS